MTNLYVKADLIKVEEVLNKLSIETEKNKGFFVLNDSHNIDFSQLTEINSRKNSDSRYFFNDNYLAIQKYDINDDEVKMQVFRLK